MLEPVFDCQIKISVHFKEGIKKSVKHNENENVSLKQLKKSDNMLDSLKLKKSSTNSTNRNKIQQFVVQLMNDKQAYYQLCDICDQIKYQRAKSIGRQSNQFSGLKARDLYKQITNYDLEPQQYQSNLFLTGLADQHSNS